MRLSESKNENEEIDFNGTLIFPGKLQIETFELEICDFLQRWTI